MGNEDRRPNGRAEVGADSFRRAIAAERLRNVQRLNLFRFVGVGIATVTNVVLPLYIVEARQRQASSLLFVTYFAAATAVYWAGRRSDRFTKLGELAIPLIDMPVIFALALGSIARSPGEASQAVFTIAPYVLLILVSAFSLESSQVLVAAVVAAVLEATLLHVSGFDLGLVIGSVMLLLGAGVLSLYPSRRSIHLLRDVATEQLFLSPEIGRLVLERGLSSLMNQSRVELSVVACDLRGFTPFSNVAASEQVLALLQEYYDAIGGVVRDLGGTVKDHAGDGILCLVGAPLAHADHAPRAVAMALRMRERGTEVLGRWRGAGFELGLGIGITSGSVTVGAIQGATRLEYVAVGPPVTLAVRLADRARSGQILLDDETAKAVRDGLAEQKLEDLQAVEIQGFAQPISIFALG